MHLYRISLIMSSDTATVVWMFQDKAVWHTECSQSALNNIVSDLIKSTSPFGDK